MCDKFSKLKIRDIVMAMINYKVDDENSTTVNYFYIHGRKFPVMRIIKSAMEINGSFESLDYNNSSCCEKTLIAFLDLSEGDFDKKEEDSL